MDNANHPFVKFLKKMLPEVLEHEEYNTSHVYLYLCNGSWLAFERSAYAVCQQLSLSNSKVMRLHLYADGRKVVTVWLDDWQKAQITVNVRISVISFCMWKNRVMNDE